MLKLSFIPAICKAADHVTETIYILCFRKKQTGDSKLGKDHVVAMPFDYDNMSLMSYNSIRDCTPSATPKTAPTVQCYPGQLPQSAYENLQVGEQMLRPARVCRVQRKSVEWDLLVLGFKFINDLIYGVQVIMPLF